MLSYRHGFHAGGWADVHKHVALTLLLSHLRQKPTAFSVIDAFSGDAVYDLAAPDAQKTGEFVTGITRIWDAADAPPGVEGYLAVVHAANRGGRLAIYPGSPALARALLRDGDRLILNELHPTAHRALAAWAEDDPRVAVHRRDAAELIGALVTPQLKRGVVLIDPAYEVKAEYETIPAAVVRAVKAWPQGIFAVWYPVLAEARHLDLMASLYRALADMDNLASIVAEIAPSALVLNSGRGMRGAGLVIINPPWQFDDEMARAGAWLAGRLWSPKAGRHILCPLADYDFNQ